MIINIKYEVNRCKECPYISNSSQEHNCSFTSAPYPTIYYCNNIDFPNHRNRIIHNNVIDNDCPEKNNGEI